MGKATRWLRSLFRSKRPSTRSIGSGSWRHQEIHGSGGISYPELLDSDKHTLAVAAATAAVAEAAFAAAHAAAEVVRLTNESFGGREGRAWYGGERRRKVAAVIIQSAFRAYLARRALRALKALVKLQALVRGHIVRKQSADMLHRMQAMARVQARASATRAISSGSPHSSSRSSHFHLPPLSSPTSKTKGFFNRDRRCVTADENNDKILEVDTWKPRIEPKPRNKSIYDLYFMPNKLMSTREAEQAMSTSENISRGQSASSKDGNVRKRSNFGHAGRREYSQSLFGGYSSHPSYMANTESFRAKLRSNSVPRQRILFERSSSTRQCRDYLDTNSERCFRG